MTDVQSTSGGKDTTSKVGYQSGDDAARDSDSSKVSGGTTGELSVPPKKRKRVDYDSPQEGSGPPFVTNTKKTTKIKMPCPVCNGVYSNRDNVKRHIRQTHPQISEEQILEWVPPMINRDMKNYSFVFVCRVCDDSFAYKHNLKRHMMTIHKIPEIQAAVYCNSIKDKDGNTPGSKPRKLGGSSGVSRPRSTRKSQDHSREQRERNPMDYDTRDYIGKLRKNVTTV
jgi:hypothetical protein